MRIDKSNITAVILAGGRGQRLGGQDKGLVNYQGKPLIQHVIQRIHSQVGEVAINANRNIKAYETYATLVFNDEENDFKGPLAGISAAIKVVKTEYIVTLPCDGPSLPLDLVSRMLSKLNELKDSSRHIVVAHDGERLQPVHALIPLKLLDNLEDFLANGERKVKLWYDRHKVLSVDFSDQPNAFFNINIEEQLAEINVND